MIDSVVGKTNADGPPHGQDIFRAAGLSVAFIGTGTILERLASSEPFVAMLPHLVLLGGVLFCVLIYRSGIKRTGVYHFGLLVEVFALIAMIGQLSAMSDLRSYNPVFLISIKDSAGEVTVVLLRTFQKGILAHDIQRERIVFYPWEHLTMISRKERPDQRTLLCRIIRRTCPEHTVP